MSQVDFKSAPALGTVLRLDQQIYELIGSGPSRRKDGSTCTVLTWLTTCPVCDRPFEVTSGLVTKGLNRRCPEHQKGGRPVRGKRGRKVTASVVIP